MRFTIVVPVYNVADYLGTCMSSILAQKLEDDEIILVDDGSTDGKSGALCDDYAAAHPDLVRVIHQQNGGLGAARPSAAGSYVATFTVPDFAFTEMALSPDTFLNATLPAAPASENAFLAAIVRAFEAL